MISEAPLPATLWRRSMSSFRGYALLLGFLHSSQDPTPVIFQSSVLRLKSAPSTAPFRQESDDLDVLLKLGLNGGSSTGLVLLPHPCLVPYGL